jgi:hypothetical protein
MARFSQIEGYRCLGLVRASLVVKFQSEVVYWRSRFCCAERGIENEWGFESRRLRKGVSINGIGPKKRFQRNISHAALAVSCDC